MAKGTEREDRRRGRLLRGTIAAGSHGEGGAPPDRAGQEPTGAAQAFVAPAPGRESKPSASEAAPRKANAGARGRRGPGRLEAIEEAIGRGAIGDPRAIDLLLAALDDRSAAIADRVAKEVLPSCGRTILPGLRRGLAWSGKAGDARRLAVITAIDPEEGRALCRRAIEMGKPPLKAQALEILSESDPEGAAAIALGLLSATAVVGRATGRPKLNPRVHIVASTCLGKSSRDEALEYFLASLMEEDYRAVFAHYAAQVHLTTIPHPAATDRLVRELERIATESRALRPRAPKGKKLRAPQEVGAIEEVAEELLSIIGERGDPGAVPTLLGLLDHPSPEWRRQVAEALVALGDPAGLEAVATMIDDPETWAVGFEAAWKLPPGPRFERLSPFCRDLSTAAGKKKKAVDFGEAILVNFEVESEDEDRRTDWDPRWADVLRPHLDGPRGFRVALALEVVLGAGAVPDLLRVLARRSISGGEIREAIAVIEALGQLRAREAVGPLVEKYTAGSSLRFSIVEALRQIGDPAAIPLLEARAGKMRGLADRNRIQSLIDELSDRPSS